MKRGTVGHFKMARLASALNLPRYAAVGILQSLWDAAAEYAPRGDIGSWSDDELAFHVAWPGDPAPLIRALLETRWIDASDEHRLVIHDWHDHCEDSVRRRCFRMRTTWATTGQNVGWTPKDDGHDGSLWPDNAGQNPTATVKSGRRPSPADKSRQKPPAPSPSPSPTLTLSEGVRASERADRKPTRARKPSANGTHEPPAWIDTLPDSPAGGIVRLVASLWRGVADWTADEALAFMSGIPPGLAVDDVRPRLVSLRNSNDYRWPERNELIKIFRELAREKRKVTA